MPGAGPLRNWHSVPLYDPMDPWFEATPWPAMGAAVGEATRQAISGRGVPPLFDGPAATRHETMGGWAAHLEEARGPWSRPPV